MLPLGPHFWPVAVAPVRESSNIESVARSLAATSARLNCSVRWSAARWDASPLLGDERQDGGVPGIIGRFALGPTTGLAAQHPVGWSRHGGEARAKPAQRGSVAEMSMVSSCGKLSRSARPGAFGGDRFLGATRRGPMRLDLPAGSPIRLTATARSTIGFRRWDVRVLTSADRVPRVAYGSEIGGRDCQQDVDIPAQDAHCRLVVGAGHTTPAGWQNDESTITYDTPSRLQIGFSDPGPSAAQQGDLLLSFVLGRNSPPTGDNHGQRPEEIQSRDAKAQTGQAQACGRAVLLFGLHKRPGSSGPKGLGR